MIGEYVKFKRKVSQIQMKMLENISKFWINFGKKKSMSHSVMKKDYTNTKLLWLGSIK